MKYIYSLHFKVVGTISLLLLFLGCSALFSIIQTTKIKIINVEKELTSVLSKTLGDTITYQILFFDPSIVQEVLGKVTSNKSIEFAYVMDSDKNIIAHTFTPYIPSDLQNSIILKNRISVIKSQDFGPLLVSIQPLYNKDVGYFVLGHKLTDLIPLWIKLTSIMLLALLLVISIISTTLSHSITRPLDKIISEISSCDSDGIPKEYVTINKTKEIGMLTETINRMIKSVKTSRSELEAHKENLENLVTLRTIELKNSIENLKITQEQLIEREKMSSLGELVAGVAHEINTPVGIGVTAASHLDSISSDFLKLYETKQLSKSEFEEYITDIKNSSNIIFSNMKRAASLINSFKQVAVDQSSEEKREFKLVEYINELLLSLHSQFRATKHNVSIVYIEEITVMTYPGAISQILTNLLMNSLIHGLANKDNGKIVIELSQTNNNIHIKYSDNGVGMCKKDLKRIYDPFFTTKRGSGGSGLGMNIVYNLVTSSLRGLIDTKSTLGDGIEFNITFPLKLK